ncbi:MAG: alpha amylase C-terminal domain-containing protein [Bacteroidales bacterium]
MGKGKIFEIDSELRCFEWFVSAWNNSSDIKELMLTQDLGNNLSSFANGHLWFGLHETASGWIIRDWAPNATAIYLVGSFNNWTASEEYRLNHIGNESWELKLPKESLKHNDLYAFEMHWHDGGYGKRIPAWAQRVVQDEETKIFNAQVWSPEKKYDWKNINFKRKEKSLFIYEAHIGMSGEEERVHTYDEFRENILPRVIEDGYNAIQLMAIMEHPYYGSFGYHVSSFFAPSSRFGTPDQLKALIDEAHNRGITVIMDIVHSHAVKNQIEGLGAYDGTKYQFFHGGDRGEHRQWDSLCFDYNKNQVIHFLLSNIKYWITEFKFDGFRFDGVTSMLYHDHGLGMDFGSYESYFNQNLDIDALVYFQLANKLMKELNPESISIAEEVSALPGLTISVDDGGVGFDYRMAMGIPDYWIKLLKHKSDEQWNMGQIFGELVSHRVNEKLVSYVESHDQALVGDKTTFFRMVDKEIYHAMRKDQENAVIDRGIALHKILRLVTASTARGAYLNFMGNEFGHPEWIDFPRDGNDWSYKHARRIWSISENPELRFEYLLKFDNAMINYLRRRDLLAELELNWEFGHETDQIMVISRGLSLFIFNFNPNNSFTDYGVPAQQGKYRIELNSDSPEFGGHGRIDESIDYHTNEHGYLMLYLPSRTGIVLERK